jgi:hypothetical protein
MRNEKTLRCSHVDKRHVQVSDGIQLWSALWWQLQKSTSPTTRRKASTLPLTRPRAGETGNKALPRATVAG